MVNKDFQRIAKAIDFINKNSQEQPSLAQIASHINLSAHHFHRLFVRYCGLTPKQFLQVLTVKSAKKILDMKTPTLTAALQSGLSGGNRLHDHFINIEAVTPGEYRSGGDKLVFYWGLGASPFGEMWLAWTDRGVHRIEFINDDDIDQPMADLNAFWPKASFEKDSQTAKEKITKIFDTSQTQKTVKLWVSGTNFQISVWRALLSLNSGELRSYQDIATAICKPNACRAVGSAIGKNPVAYLIPCHRVIQSSGVLGEYRWDAARKQIMLTQELKEVYAAQNSAFESQQSQNCY